MERAEQGGENKWGRKTRRKGRESEKEKRKKSEK